MKFSILVLYLLLINTFFKLMAQEIPVFSGNSPYKIFIKNNISLTFLSHGIYELPKQGKQKLLLHILLKNEAVSTTENDSDHIFQIRNQERELFELKSHKRIYATQQIQRKKYHVQSLLPGQDHILTLTFLIESGDSLDQLEIRYITEDILAENQIHNEKNLPISKQEDSWIKLEKFLQQGPNNTVIMAVHGYFTVLGYIFYSKEKKNKTYLDIKIKLGNDRNHNSYFVTGFIPNTSLTYAGERYYYFELTDGETILRPKNSVFSTELYNADKEDSGKSSDKVLIPSDLRELSLTFVLNKNVNLQKLALRYKDPYGYVKPSSWLPLGTYFENVPPFQIKKYIQKKLKTNK